MSKQSRRKYYAVRVGREGPKVYETWSECHANVSKWHGAIYKSFLSQKEAEEWAAVPTGQSNSSSVNTARHLGQALASAPADFVHSQENIPKSSRRKYYAVHVGREGPKVYETWQECQANVGDGLVLCSSHSCPGKRQKNGRLCQLDNPSRPSTRWTRDEHLLQPQRTSIALNYPFPLVHLPR
ncbi:hypothetical protein SCLCIDRAFT_837599 [Scleroderma citrinum Foug A]|uniref:Ribonuclease H1 N-terminal domain-containing protein n=1 Tax=Scleroderma citrinum Foug A TaxID=1036808 RepID=A0A0C3DNG4_9AGAM|nr:hypothetical protein SCLCIDRAFT_837599 [Scleroderma citrinum Foug A]